jgi:Ca2+-binding RTX toxin-like protein
VVITQGPRWGVYKDTQADGTAVEIWSGANSPAGSDGDVVDGGAGNDWVIASWGDDRVQGGADDDQIDGLAGDDILEGGTGVDVIHGDGGSDEIYGGVGNDNRHTCKKARRAKHYKNNSCLRLFHGTLRPISHTKRGYLSSLTVTSSPLQMAG